MGTGLHYKRDWTRFFKKVNRHNFLVKDGFAVTHNQETYFSKNEKKGMGLKKGKFCFIKLGVR